MFQQILALIIIAFFFFRLIWQRKKGQINRSEFNLWFIFWVLATLAIVFIREIDRLVASLGFSREGIDILFYIAVIILFYLVFKVRIRQAKIEKEITKVVREVAINKNDSNASN